MAKSRVTRYLYRTICVPAVMFAGAFLCADVIAWRIEDRIGPVASVETGPENADAARLGHCVWRAGDLLLHRPADRVAAELRGTLCKDYQLSAEGDVQLRIRGGNGVRVDKLIDVLAAISNKNFSEWHHIYVHYGLSLVARKDPQSQFFGDYLVPVHRGLVFFVFGNLKDVRMGVNMRSLDPTTIEKTGHRSLGPQVISGSILLNNQGF